MPKGMRYSTLKEREEFYREEFNLESVEKWFSGKLKNVVFAVIIGRHTGIYLKKYREDASTTILIDEYKDLTEVKDQILEFLPEAVYYDRNIYGDKGAVFSQQLAFNWASYSSK